MTPIESVVAFRCDGAQLWGILSRPDAAEIESSIGVLIVVGGPQYRVGSHRQFVLLARALARQGFPALRFDYRGMGDSEGSTRDFNGTAPDLHAALDALFTACPGLTRVVVWGLCDAASAALMFATADQRVAGIVAVNPWARSVASLAAVHVRHYYLTRLMQPAFWSKLLAGGLDIRASLGALIGNLKGARAAHRTPFPDHVDRSFQTAMARGLARFRGQLLLILSGNDLTAREFVQYTGSAPAWRGLLSDPRISRVDLPAADHTFSHRVWQARVEEETVAWLKRLGVLGRVQEQTMGQDS